MVLQERSHPRNARPSGLVACRAENRPDLVELVSPSAVRQVKVRSPLAAPPGHGPDQVVGVPSESCWAPHMAVRRIRQRHPACRPFRSANAGLLEGDSGLRARVRIPPLCEATVEDADPSLSVLLEGETANCEREGGEDAHDDAEHRTTLSHRPAKLSIAYIQQGELGIPDDGWCMASQVRCEPPRLGSNGLRMRGS